MDFRNNFLTLKKKKFCNSGRIIGINSVNNSKELRRLNIVKFLFNLSISASAFAPSELILVFPKIMTRWKKNRVIRAIINKNTNFASIASIIKIII